MRTETGQTDASKPSCSSVSRCASGLLLSLCLALAAALPASADRVKIRPADGVSAKELIDDLQKQMADESKPETAFEARRQTKRAATLITDLLNSKGYYDPDVQTLVRTENGYKPIVILDPGKRFKIGVSKIDYLDTPPEADLQDSFQKEEDKASGTFAIPATIIHRETEIIQQLREAGYPYARAEDRKVLGDREAATLDITYQISSGPKVRFGEVVFPDNIDTKSSYLRRLIPFKSGDIYNPGRLAQFGSRLDETRIFTLANARLSDTPSRTDETGDEVRDIIVTATERKRHTVEAGVSLSTDKGFGLSADLTRRNLTKRGDFLIASLDLTSLEQTLNLTWRRPHEFGYGKNLVFGSKLSNEDTDAYNRQSFSLSGGFENRKNRRFTYGYGVEGSLIREEDQFSKRDLQLISLYSDAAIDQANSVLNATKGWRAEGRIEPSVSFGGDETQFIRGSAQLRGYYPLNDDHSFVLAGRIRAGSVWGAQVEALPSESRFFTGGGGSVRGYAYQDIGPLSADNEPTGGKSLLETSFEARWMFKPKISLVGFVDAGNVSTHDVPGFSDMRFGTGFGVRYDTLAGPLRIDIATPIDKRERDDPVQIYISLGQAF